MRKLVNVHINIFVIYFILVQRTDIGICEELFTRDVLFDDIEVTTGLLRSIIVSSFAKCAIECYSTRNDCKLLTYSHMTSSCRLHNTQLIGSATRKTDKTMFFRRNKARSCGTPPLISNSSMQYSGLTVGNKATYTCHRGLNFSLCPVGDGVIHCQNDGKWESTSFKCLVVETCSHIRNCNSSYADGEYFVYPNITDRQQVKVYCHNMSTSQPKEYISLYNDNKAVHNFSLQTGSGNNCEWSDRAGDAVTIFKKIRISTTDMTVIRDDFTFATVLFEEPKRSIRSFGSGADCSSRDNNCPKLGYFKIDTTGTGLRVDPTLKWKAGGFRALIQSFTRQLATIEGICGGYCGSCNPDGPMRLFVDSRIETYDTANTITPTF